MTEHLQTTTRVIAEIPEGFELFAVSDDRENVAIMSDGDPRKAKVVLLVNGVEVALEDYASRGQFTASGVLAFSERKGVSWRLRIGDEFGPWHDAVINPVFSEDGLHYMYIGREPSVRKGYARANTGRRTLMVDGEAYHPEFDVQSALRSPDGRVALVAKREPTGMAVILDGKVIAESDDAKADFSHLEFSRDGRLAFLEQIDTHYARAVCGDYRSEIGRYPILVSGFSPTGVFFHQLTLAPDDLESTYWLIVGNQRVQTHGGVSGAVFFGPDGSLRAYLETTATVKQHRLVYPAGESVLVPRVVNAAYHVAKGRIAFVCSGPRNSATVWYAGATTAVFDHVLTGHFRFSDDGSKLQFVALRGNLLTFHEVDTSRDTS